MKPEFKRILVIMFRAVGDVLLCTPFVSVLRRQYPDAHIAFMAEPLPAQVIENNPDIDEIIYYRKKKNDALGSLKFFRETGKKGWDLTIDVLGTPGAAWATFFSGANVKVGYTVRIRNIAYNIKVDNRVPPRYTALKRFDLLKAIGIEEETPDPILKLYDSEFQTADAFIESAGIDTGKFTICCAPGSKRQARAWRNDGWAELCDRLISEYSANIILLWGPGEEPVIEEITGLMKTEPYVIPKTSIREMAAIMSRTHLCLSNCSGPLHLGVSVGLPTVAFYGATNPKDWTYPDPDRHRIVIPEGLECLECNLKVCDHKSCMHQTGPDDFIREIGKIPELNRFLNST